MNVIPGDWDTVRAALGIPHGWRLRPRWHDGGWWTLHATAPRDRSLPCGHRSMNTTAPNLVLAVARMARCVDFHRRECR